MVTDSLTPAEAQALLELLRRHAGNFVNRPYTPELLNAIRKLRALAATGSEEARLT
jgi:hypothetical protein